MEYKCCHICHVLVLYKSAAEWVAIFSQVERRTGYVLGKDVSILYVASSDT